MGEEFLESPEECCLPLNDSKQIKYSSRVIDLLGVVLRGRKNPTDGE